MPGNCFTAGGTSMAPQSFQRRRPRREQPGASPEVRMAGMQSRLCHSASFHRTAISANMDMTACLVLYKIASKEQHMATNLALDPDLLERAFRASGEATKKAAVTRALQEFIARREQRRIAELFGRLQWDGSFDYKAERTRKQ